MKTKLGLLLLILLLSVGCSSDPEPVAVSEPETIPLDLLNRGEINKDHGNIRSVGFLGDTKVRDADLILVHEGKAKAVIVLSEDPSSAAKKAAKVLIDHLFQISGARLEVVKESAFLRIRGLLLSEKAL